MKKRIAGVAALVAAAAVAIATVAIAAGGTSGIALQPTDLAATLVVDGIEGADPGSPAIEVLSWSFGVSSASTVVGGGGGGAGKATFGELKIVKPIDKASPLLFKACATGQHIKDVTLTVLRPGKVALPYIQYKLTDAFVTSVNHSGNGDSVPSEQVSFDYRKIEVKYTTIDGSVVGSQFDTAG
jgi:type VI secretion system secreted protein Hcp